MHRKTKIKGNVTGVPADVKELTKIMLILHNHARCLCDASTIATR